MAAKILRVVIFVLLLSTSCFVGVRAQDTIVRLVNDDFIMEVHRDSDAVNVVVNFIDPSKFSNLAFEKGQWSDGEFRQFADVDREDTSVNSGTVEVRDNYPLNQFYDTYYRIRAATSDGGEKIYTALLLPAKPVPVRKIHL